MKKALLNNLLYTCTMEKVQRLDSWDFYDTVVLHDGYGTKRIPKANTENMAILLEKINELSAVVNKIIETQQLEAK